MISTVALAAAIAGTLDLSDTSSVQLRVTPQAGTNGGGVGAGAGGVPSPPVAVPGGVVSPTGVDLATIPRALLRMGDRNWEYALEYSPQLWVLDVGTGTAFEHPLLYQLGTAIVGYHRGNLHLTLTENASYGEFNSALLNTPLPTQTAPTPVPTPGQSAGSGPLPPMAGQGQPPVGQTSFQIVPAQTTIREGASRTDLTVGTPLSRQVGLTLGVGFLWGGGLDQPSQLVMALQTGPHASATVGYAPSMVDRFATAVSGSTLESTGGVCVGAASPVPQPGGSALVCRQRDEFASFQETWMHAFSRVWTLAVGAGGGFGHTRTEVAPTTQVTSFFPTGQIALVYRFGHLGANSVTIGAQSVPAIDPVTGQVTDPVSATLAIFDDLTRRVRLRYGMAAGQTLPVDAPGAATGITGNVAADFRVDQDVTATVGQWLVWQEQRGYGTIFSTSTYVALSVRARTTRLR